MIHVIYCKINEFRATFISLERQFDLLDTNLDKIVAQLPPEMQEITPILREHLHCLPKAKKKLPSWIAAGCIVASTPYEQSTAEDIASFRASIFPAGKLLSLTGGLGADDIAFAKNNFSVTSIDSDECLNALFYYNSERMGIHTVKRISHTAEKFLESNTEKFDYVLIDPDRRATGKRVDSQMADYSPDIFGILTSYKHISPSWLIKLSPMVDIRWLQNQFSDSVDVWVMSSGSEVKEIMLEISPKASGKTTLACIQGKEINRWDGQDTIVFDKTDDTYFSEPSAGCIKSGLHRRLAAIDGFDPVNAYHTFFTGKVVLPHWLGRSILLIERIEGSVSTIGKRLKELTINKANITCRDFVLGAEETRKKLKMADGGDFYLFFTGKKDKICFVCRR